jgi:hypothetical protein
MALKDLAEDSKEAFSDIEWAINILGVEGTIGIAGIISILTFAAIGMAVDCTCHNKSQTCLPTGMAPPYPEERTDTQEKMARQLARMVMSSAKIY